MKTFVSNIDNGIYDADFDSLEPELWQDVVKRTNKLKKEKQMKKTKDGIANFDSLPDCAQIRLPTVCLLYGVSAATIWRMVKFNIMPQPLRLTPRTTTWNVGEIRKHLKGL